ncbi:MAG: type I-D CRISPR-associated protein Cas10d/Csc3 [Thermoflexales bacterium]|nr:type I-D CRISPR-associated protein Cas10d/Csc3 [Thermoflexales bacterium]
MLTQSDIAEILSDYVETVVPAMWRRAYHLVLVKGGPEYPHLSEQSHFTHIVNGVFALARLLEFIARENVAPSRLDGSVLRKALALYTVHEVHKDREVERGSLSEFDLPLERLREEYRALGLEGFAGTVGDHLLRAANVHKRSSRHGDLLLADDPDAQRLWLLVRIADAMASSQTPEEAARSLQGYLTDLAGPAFAPQSPPGRFALHFHELRDVRGVLTNAVHEAIARYLEANPGFFPLLFFATGTLYLGPARVAEEVADGLVPAVAEAIIQSLARGTDATTIRTALRAEKYDFERYVYTFATAEDLLETVYEDTLRATPDPQLARKEIDKLAREGRQGLPTHWRETVEERLGIRLLDPREHRTFNEHWSRVWRYLLYVDSLLRALHPAENSVDWLLRVFGVAQPYADNLRQVATIWAKGGLGKHVLVIAYHFLRGPDFADRPAETLPPEEVLRRLHRRTLEAFQQVDTQAGREAVATELGLRPDLEAYLRENLRLSFAPAVSLEEDGLQDALARKTRGHTGKVCSLCNRRSEYTRELTTGVLDDFGRVFSNRVLPRPEAPGGNRLWCPICHLEFILRKRMGMGLPRGADYGNTHRIYLYVLPTYSFTPEHLRLWEKWLSPFHRVTHLPVRDYGRDDPGLPRLWLERRSFDPDWMETVREVLDREAQKIARWGSRGYVGERALTGPVRGQPHYHLIIWEKAAREREQDPGRLATRTEAWAKALFAAIVLSGLTGCKVYVTERPYLPVADSADLKATITLDGPPPALRRVLGGRGDAVSLYGREKSSHSGLERTLDLCAALWTVTAEVGAPGRATRDKQVAERLEAFNTSPLAGATFYKEFARLNLDRPPSPALTEACKILLEAQGGELMSLVEKIAQKSLEIALPRGMSGRGKARRYELVFRETVSAMRQAQRTIPEIRETAAGQGRPSAQSIAELKQQTAGTLLKALERRQQTRRGEVFVHAWGEELTRKVGEFVDLVVDELYLGRAGGSFARFLRLENAIADGIYYYTDRNLSRYWEEVKQRRGIPESEIAEEV